MASIGGPNIVESGLVLSLDAANIKSYTSGSATWFDKSGFGNNGTLTNGPTFDSANGGSIVVDGVDDFISLGSGAASLIQGKTNISIGIMFNLIALGSLRGLLGTLNYFCGGNLGLVASSAELLFYNDTGTCNAIALSGYVQTGKWIYAVGTYDGTTTRLYGVKDGVLTQTSSTVKSGNTNTFSTDFRVMGNQNPSIFTNGRGSIAHVYNRTLTVQEVEQNYNAIKSRYNL
jgi:hypothetical protein